MDKYIKQFIEKYKNLLADEDFTSLYKKADKELPGYPDIGSLTQIFLDLDIDPLDYMSEIPNGYLLGAVVKSVDIPDHITNIGKSAFRRCNGLTSIIIPDSVTSIGDWAFNDCNSLTSVTIGSGVATIGDSVFKNCSKLTSVTIGNDVMTIGYGAFRDCSGLTGITIPNSVTSIENQAFNGCIGLTSIAIPDSVTDIGYFAFENCSGLTRVAIGSGVTSIGGGAFQGCTSLKEIYITDIAAWCNIKFDSGLLQQTYNLYLNNELVTDLVIPDNVASISDWAFFGCNSLARVNIPKSVTNIGIYAFSGCSSLTNINYSGTKAEWQKINKNLRWKYKTSLSAIHCTDGDLKS